MAGKFPTHKWIDQKACSDFFVPSQADLRQYFGKDSQIVFTRKNLQCIIRVDGSLSGYPGSLEAKKKLLALEQNAFTI